MFFQALLFLLLVLIHPICAHNDFIIINPDLKAQAREEQYTEAAEHAAIMEAAKNPISYIDPYISKRLGPLQSEKQSFAIFGGYICPEAYWDTRQVTGLREDEVIFLPQPAVIVNNNQDINAAGMFDMVTIRTRVNALLRGPEILGAGTLGFIEGDFMAVEELTPTTFHMRHAYIRMDWNKTGLLLGQGWHPFFVIDCCPETISFNTGCPFESFARSPQVRLEQALSNHWMFMLAALAEVDFRDYGPLIPGQLGPGLQSTTFLRNSIVPLFDFQLRYKSDTQLYGVGVEVRSIKPRLESVLDYKVHERLTSCAAIAYAKFIRDQFTFKIKFIYGQNVPSFLMLGGYAIKSVNPVTKEYTYTALQQVDLWFELIYGKRLQPGLFMGFYKNLGATSCLAPIATVPNAIIPNDLTYGRSTNVDWAMRCSPRFTWTIKNVNFCAELEITHALYGAIQRNGTVRGNDPETNVRLLLATFYNF